MASDYTGRAEIFEDAAGGWRFRIKANNGEIVATSESYASKMGAVNGVSALQHAVYDMDPYLPVEVKK